MYAIHTKQAPYMTYVVGARVPKGSVTDALYWDTLKAYHYVRIQPMPAMISRGLRRFFKNQRARV